jgi:hypothetical protein
MKAAIESRVRREVLERVNEALSFDELTIDTALDVDGLARRLLLAARRDNSLVEPPRDSDRRAILADLSSEKQKQRFMRYEDALNHEQLYYAEAGYLIGIAVEAALRARRRPAVAETREQNQKRRTT